MAINHAAIAAQTLAELKANKITMSGPDALVIGSATVAQVHATLALVEEQALVRAEVEALNATMDAVNKTLKRVADAMEARIPAEQPDSFIG